MSRRALGAVLVLVLWVAGLALLVRREYFRPPLERLARAASRVTPGAVYYAVFQGERQIGFASSTIDTSATAIAVRDYLVAHLPVGGSSHRAIARTDVLLSRGLRVRQFQLGLDTDGPALRASGRVEGDSLLVLGVATGTQRPDTQRVTLAGPILLPTLVPLAISLGERPKVGRHYELPTFDPIGMAPRQMQFTVRAESLFVIADSAVFDSTTRRWRPVTPDTIRAWQVESEGGVGSGFNGWIDEQGRVVRTTQLGFELRRLPYEVAWDNWRMDEAASGDSGVTADRDILETTAIQANKRLRSELAELRLRLANVDLRGFDLAGGRQTLRGDTLVVTREPAAALQASYQLPLGGARRLPDYVRAEPLLQVDDPRIRGTAERIVGAERDPAAAARRIYRWVYDSLADRITVGVPDALAVLRARSGDCNEHTQLFTALSRSVGIPTRIAAGLAFIDGKFYYHAWPEVFLNGWVAVDPTFGQFPADAAHLRFTVGGLGRQAELLRLIGNLEIEVVRAEGLGSRVE